MLYTIIALLSGSSKPAKAISVVGLSQPPLFLTSTPFACGYSAANRTQRRSEHVDGRMGVSREGAFSGHFVTLAAEMESHADIDYPVPMSVRSVSDGGMSS
jgi:hypothetical protein